MESFIVKVRFNGQVVIDDFWRIISANAPIYFVDGCSPTFEEFRDKLFAKVDANDFTFFLRLTNQQYMYFVKHQSSVTGVDYILGGREKTFWDDHEFLGEDFVSWRDD